MLSKVFSNLHYRLTESKLFAFGFWFAWFLFFLIIDLVTKQFVTMNGWSIFKNDQLVFSIPAPLPIIYFLYLVVVLIFVTYIKKQFWTSEWSQQLAWVLIISGGVGNISERIFRGYVTDFIYLFNGVFNLADFFIILGLLILLLYHQKNEHIK